VKNVSKVTKYLYFVTFHHCLNGNNRINSKTNLPWSGTCHTVQVGALRKLALIFQDLVNSNIA